MIIARRQMLAGAIVLTAGASAPLLAPRKGAGPARAVLGQVPAQVAEQAPPLLADALAALDAHGPRIAQRDRIGLVDFSRPSGEPRFQVVNLASGAVEREWLVSHGRGSDPADTGRLQSFSNVPDSNASSRGAYLTADAYVGKHGPSRRLVGLDRENSNALDRAIVMHGADYVSAEMARDHNRVGRSLGCFAVALDVRDTMLDLLGEGRLLYCGKAA